LELVDRLANGNAKADQGVVFDRGVLGCLGFLRLETISFGKFAVMEVGEATSH
jgi:hypothetical protein